MLRSFEYKQNHLLICSVRKVIDISACMQTENFDAHAHTDFDGRTDGMTYTLIHYTHKLFLVFQN